jgi:circadian clock protein KaiB
MMEEPRGVVLFLFVANDAPKSIMAIENIQLALAELADRTYALEIVNVYDDPDRALSNRVLVTPTLLAPASARRLVGDLSEKTQLHYFLQGLPVPLAS